MGKKKKQTRLFKIRGSLSLFLEDSLLYKMYRKAVNLIGLGLMRIFESMLGLSLRRFVMVCWWGRKHVNPVGMFSPFFVNG